MPQGLVAGLLMGLGEGQLRKMQISQMKEQNTLNKLKMDQAKQQAEMRQMFMEQLGMGQGQGQPGMGPDQGQQGGQDLIGKLAGNPGMALGAEMNGIPAFEMMRTYGWKPREIVDGTGAKQTVMIDQQGNVKAIVGQSGMPPTRVQTRNVPGVGTVETDINPYTGQPSAGGGGGGGGGYGLGPKPRLGPAVAPQEIQPFVNEAAQVFGLDPELILRVIDTESNFNPRATSPKGAMGLMQLMPDTAQDLGVKDPYDPRQNIYGGAKYLRQMLDRYDGNVEKALAAFNAGPGRVDKAGGVPNIKETKAYVAQAGAGYTGPGVVTKPPELETYTFEKDGKKYEGVRDALTKKTTVDKPLLIEEAKGASGESAGKLAGAYRGKILAPQIRALFVNEKGEFNRALAMQASAPMGGIGDGRLARAMFDDALDARARLATGAAMPDSEKLTYYRMYFPSPLDNKKTVMDKFDRFKEWMDTAVTVLDPSGKTQKQIEAGAGASQTAVTGIGKDGKRLSFRSAEDVRAAVQAGLLERGPAKQILEENFADGK